MTETSKPSNHRTHPCFSQSMQLWCGSQHQPVRGSCRHSRPQPPLTAAHFCGLGLHCCKLLGLGLGSSELHQCQASNKHDAVQLVAVHGILKHLAGKAARVRPCDFLPGLCAIDLNRVCRCRCQGSQALRLAGFWLWASVSILRLGIWV